VANYIEKLNEIRDAIITLLSDADIKNTNGIAITVYKRALPSNFSKEKCPAVSVYKVRLTGANENKDQSDVEVPKELKVIVGISDYSLTDLDDAEVKTDDLIDKIITEFETDPSLNGLVKGIEITNIDFDDDNRKGIWYSEPSIELTLSAFNYIFNETEE